MMSTALLARGHGSAASRRSAALLPSCFRSVRYASAAAVATPPTGSQKALLPTLLERFPNEKDLIQKRYEKLKQHHFQFLSADVNWKYLSKEEQQKQLADLDVLLKDGWHKFSPEQKKQVSMATVDENSSQLPMPEWDAIVNKNEELQAGDWHKMSSEEKKAAYILAFGPKPVAESSFKWKVLAGVVACIGGAYLATEGLQIYGGRRKAATMTAEWQEATNRKMKEAGMNPIKGISSKDYKGPGYIQESNNIKS